ncbi:hypothetical protein GHT06_009876 [Daphnia sinensis]|uniref:Secreted protein n=1 Tax=Daphnia sinensis TaxID=1820382 RepID=A0AAD5KX97_9CRUS|nr:hypothetical protein GHT06_009876 [Daphnia sinensis]
MQSVFKVSHYSLFCFLCYCKTVLCSDYANGLVNDAKTRYLGNKLKLLNSEYPYSISNSLWKHGLHCCPISKSKVVKTTWRPLVHIKAFLLNRSRLLKITGLES